MQHFFFAFIVVSTVTERIHSVKTSSDKFKNFSILRKWTGETWPTIVLTKFFLKYSQDLLLSIIKETCRFYLNGWSFLAFYFPFISHNINSHVLYVPINKIAIIEKITFPWYSVLLDYRSINKRFQYTFSKSSKWKRAWSPDWMNYDWWILFHWFNVHYHQST